jgi:putative inorganic carbon (hco3(-)) transporter
MLSPAPQRPVGLWPQSDRSHSPFTPPIASWSPQNTSTRGDLDFLLFIILNAVLFIRPAEIVPALAQTPIYGCVIVVCLVVSLPAVLNQLSPVSLEERPITTCLVGILIAILVSHLAYLNFYDARLGGFEFAKIVAYYLLLVATINSAPRLQRFVRWFVVLAFIAALLAVLNYHEIISIPGLEAYAERIEDPITEEVSILPRMRGPGIFNDPNDLCLLLMSAVTLCLYHVSERRPMWIRGFWLMVLIVLGYALSLTYSRGGFLALVVALLVLSCCRFGWRITMPLAAVALPILILVLGERQTDISVTEGTGQDRIRLWSEGFAVLRQVPLFGIGQGQFSERFGLVAHNSFVHALAELGLFGGICFLGVFYFSILLTCRVRLYPALVADPMLGRLRPYLLAAICAYVAGVFSLSRCYTVTTYVLPGLVTAYGGIAASSRPFPVLKWDGRVLQGLLVASAVTVIGIYLLTRFLAHFG